MSLRTVINFSKCASYIDFTASGGKVGSNVGGRATIITCFSNVFFFRLLVVLDREWNVLLCAWMGPESTAVLGWDLHALADVKIFLHLDLGILLKQNLWITSAFTQFGSHGVDGFCFGYWRASLYYLFMRLQAGTELFFLFALVLPRLHTVP